MKIKKVLASVGLLLTCLFLSTSSVSAIKVPGPSNPAPVTPTPSDPGTSVTVEPVEPVYPSYTVYHPKVTALHSVNAMVASHSSYNGVYYLPRLEDIPLDIESICSNVTLKGSNDEHKFAIVSDCYYNGEVDIELQYSDDGLSSGNGVTGNGNAGDTANLQTSKAVYSATDSSRLLTICGYDILLSNEVYQLSADKSAGEINIDYYPTVVGTAPLAMETIVMDIYKAIGVYEYDIDLAWGIDPDFDINQSPILNDISVLTDDVEMGVDTSEVKTYVAITRTNPDQYWERCQRDAIFNGGSHFLTAERGSYVGSETSVSKVFSRDTRNITVAEFCTVARAIMTLYGEPVLTEDETNAALQLHGVDFPRGTYDTDTYNSIMYCIAKGILDPDETDVNEICTLADIEPLLLRIADTDSRLTIKDAVNMTNQFTVEGYSPVKSIAIAEEGISTYTVDTADKANYDIFVEVHKGVDLAKVTSSAIQDASARDSYTEVTDDGIKTTYTGKQKDSYYDFANVSLVYTMGTSDKVLTADNLGTTTMYVDGATRTFYHFKVTPNISNITLQYENSDKNTTMDSECAFLDSYNLSTLTGKTDGGFYLCTNPTKKFEKKYEELNIEDMTNCTLLPNFAFYSFDDASCSDQFISSATANNSTAGKKSSTIKTVVMVIPNSYLTQATLNNYKTDSGLDFSMLLSLNNGESDTIGTGASGNTVTCWKYDYSSAGQDRTRFEFTVQETTDITDTSFYHTIGGDPNSKEQETEGYYRSSDGALMVSYNYLKTKGIVSGIDKLANDAGYTITLTKLGTNVTLMEKEKYVIVGDTIYGNIENEKLVEEKDGDYLIDYRACLGWATNYVVVPTSEDSIMALPGIRGGGDTYTNGTSTFVSNSTEKVSTFFPSATTSLMTTTVTKNSKTTKGFSMTGSYALSPYIVVMANENGQDYLFVWHRKGLTVDGVKLQEDSDKDARDKFNALTNLKCEAEADYYLVMYKLKRSNTRNPEGFTYVEIPVNNYYADNETITLGWIYTPPTYDDVALAIKDYANCTKDLAIPIFKKGGRYYDANVNTCALNDGEDMLETGILPMRLGKSSATGNKFASLDANGRYVENTSMIEIAPGVTQDQNIDMANVVIYTAPVGMFALLKGNGYITAGDYKSNMGQLYYGTSLAKFTNGSITINSFKTGFDSKEKATCAYKGIAGTSVYAVTANTTGIGDAVQQAEEAIEVAYEDPGALVDWGQYEFSRLIENVDDWSTIALIFALNILPRIAMLLFFILMLLALIKNVKPWRVFCQRVFDVYSFLTLGHQSVDSIDVKRLVGVSLACLTLFYMIMDGQLFNFIIWIAEGFVALSQH